MSQINKKVRIDFIIVWIWVQYQKYEKFDSNKTARFQTGLIRLYTLLNCHIYQGFRYQIVTEVSYICGLL